MPVCQKLNFDMAGLGEILFQIDLVVAERGLGFGAGRLDLAGQFLRRPGDLHAATAAAGRGLDQHRIADLGGNLRRRFDVADRAVGTRHHRYPERPRRLLRLHLVAHQSDMRRRRPDEGKAVLFDHLREGGVFGQKADPGVNGIGSGDRRGREYGRHVQVALGRGRRPDADRLVGQTHVHRIGIGRRVHGHRMDAHLAACPVDAQGDLAAIGDQNLFEHGPAGPRPTRPRPEARRTPPACRRRPGWP